VGGTVTGEHGVGVEKLNQMCVQFNSEELTQMHAVKAAFDPHGLLNPGKAVPTLHRCAEFGAMHVHKGQLGVRVVNGRGEVMRFGGEVMKNVAGYDISRLLTGSGQFGSLGVLLDVSVKVLAAPRTTRTIAFELPPRRAIELFASVRNRPLPLAGACHLGEHAWVRLAGSPAAVEQGTEVLMGEGGEALEETDDTQLWSALRDLRLDFFDDPRPLYRLSVPPARRPLDTPGECLIDWGGAQRWLLPAPGVELTRIRGEARALGGHATRFRPALSTTGATREQARISEVFQPLAPAVHAIHTRLKAAFDPHGILNPGRQYPGL
jgi:glycolate oxidase FAD binding subunit